jgi:hypothetical protein
MHNPITVGGKRVLDSDLTAEEILIRRLTQALKDILNAANNTEPYDAAEIDDLFTGDYNAGYAYLDSHNIAEAA